LEPYKLFWILGKLKVLLHTYRHSYTLQKNKTFKQKLTPPPFRLVSFMDCDTTRLQTEIGIFSVLDPEICKEIGRIGEILFSGPWTEKTFRENY